MLFPRKLTALLIHHQCGVYLISRDMALASSCGGRAGRGGQGV